MFGALADDTTGANDVGLAFQNGGAGVKVIALAENNILDPEEDVVVIDTNSRLDSKDIAYEKVTLGTRQLMKAGFGKFYKKACSALRGNIGAEFDALLDAAGVDTMIVSVAYPANGRSTINGHHFIHGIPLEDSNFRDDPVHPMTTGNLIKIIRTQSSRSAMVIPITEVRKGAEALRNYLQVLQFQFPYLIVDGETQEDIAILAEAASGYSAFGGSAALAEELPKHLGDLRGPSGIDETTLSQSGACLVVCGSLTPQSIEQTSLFLSTGVAQSEFKSTGIFDPKACELWLNKTVIIGRQILASGSDFLIHVSQDTESVEATRILARNHGLDDATLGKKISALQAEATARILRDAPPYPIIVAGGDTAGSICGRMNITGNLILEQIDAGVLALVNRMPLSASLFRCGVLSSASGAP